MSDKKLETLIFAQQLYNDEFRRKVLPRTKQEFFQYEDSKIIHDIIHTYVEQYNQTPTKEAVEVELQNISNLSDESFKTAQQLQEELFSSKYREAASRVDVQWLVDKTEKYYRDRQIYNAIMKSIDILDGTDTKVQKESIPELLEHALQTSFDDGNFHDYFESAEERYEYFHQPHSRIPFKLKMLNYITKGGLLRKTLNLFVGPTGSGKTMFLCDESAHWLMMGFNVLYVTLEMAEELIAQRIDANMMDLEIDDTTGIPKTAFLGKIQKLRQNTTGRLIIKEFPPGYLKAQELSMLLDDLERKHGFKADIVVLDYINLAQSSRVRSDADSYTQVKKVAEEFRGCAIKKDFCLVTATQTNRNGQNNSDYELTEVSESHGLSMTADFMIGGIVNEELEKLHQMRLKQLKNRYGPLLPSSFLIGIDRARMKMNDLDIPSKNLENNVKEQLQKRNQERDQQTEKKKLAI